MLEKQIAQALENKLCFVGMSMEIGNNVDASYFNIDEEMDNGNIRVYTSDLNSSQILYVLTNMLESGQVELAFTDKATEKNVGYLKKLCKVEVDK